ncbi:MAG: hypothetical protein R3E97_21815 [Candidatus Eisenbacteria bacterium]
MNRTSSSKQVGRVIGAVMAVAWLGALAGPSEAVRTRFFTTEGYDDFRKLELVGTELGEDGTISPGLAAVPVAGDLSVRTVWQLAATRSGIAAATGDQGNVFLIDGDGAEVLATLYNYEIFSVAAGEDGTVYAAGAPSGSVVAIGRDGSVETLFTAPEGLVFDLAVGNDGTLYVATGERGRIYRVKKGGETDVLAETGDAHVRRMVWSLDKKSLWVGTNGRGLLQTVDIGSGDVRTVFDADEEEVVDIVALPEGGCLFAGNPGPGSGGGNGAPGPDKGSDAGPPKPMLYQLSPDGSVRALWSAPESTVHALLREPSGSVLVGTGGAGGLYRVDPTGRETLLWRADEDQVLCLLQAKDGLYAGTGNPGRVYRLGPERVETATLLSDVLDAKDRAKWGKLAWQAEGRAEGVRFETRSGYTSVPDETWTDWSRVTADVRTGAAPAGTKANSVYGSGQVPSAAGRYLQWRATFDDPAKSLTKLRSVRVPYAVANRRPALSKLTISSRDSGFRSERPGGVSQVLSGGVQVDYSLGGGARGANTLPPEGVPAWVQQLRTIVWTAEDPDSDQLVFQVHIRQLGEETFRPVAKDLEDPAYTLETGLLPNGTYEVRITASDAPSNSPGEELETVSVSPPFQVDNLPPTVLGLKARRDGDSLVLSGRAVDSDSPLRALQVSVDGGEFRGIHPSDGLLDSVEEQFEVRVPLDEPDAGNWVVVQARDSAGNEGTYRAWLEP